MQVPFEKSYELFSTTGTPSNTLSPSSGSPLILPAIQEDQDHTLLLINPAKEEDMRRYLRADLNVDGLNKVHKHLWLAGLPQCARPLHYQLMIDRKITITERADLHLLWQDQRLFVKPLPDYLLSHDIWEKTLVKDDAFSENARGFLLSYLWLIRRKSDFLIAQRADLVSNNLTWAQWTSFSAAIVSNISPRVLDGISPRVLVGISPRYLYGELRLGRVNLIYRLCRKTKSLRTFVRGYFYGYHTYSSFIRQNFAWVLTVVVYITIVLTAMQVGLGTTRLKDNALFNRVSCGFTVFSIITPLAILLVLFSVLPFLIIFNLNYTLKKRKFTRKKFSTVFDNPALQPHNH